MRGALNSKNCLVSATIVAVVLLSGPAEAKRLGGGGSIGRQSHAPSSPAGAGPAGASGAQRSATPPGAANQTAPAGTPGAPANPAAVNRPGAPAPNVAPPSPWKRMLGAAAIGLGIAALASWMGVSSELASVLGIALVGLLVLALVTAFLRRRQGGPIPAHSNFNRSTTDRSRFEPTMPAPESVFAPQPVRSPALAPALAPAFEHAPQHAPKWPPGFDAPAFISQAREQFIRLQAAFDHADLATLREVASTEVFDELRRQIDERHGTINVTEVIGLETDLVEVQTDVDEYTATIRFHGLVREAPGTEPVRLNELWHLAKPRDGSAGWLLVGIQNPG